MRSDSEALLHFQQEPDWVTETSADRWLSHCVCPTSIVEPQEPRRKSGPRLLGAPIELCATRHACRMIADYLRALL